MHKQAREDAGESGFLGDRVGKVTVSFESITKVLRTCILVAPRLPIGSVRPSRRSEEICVFCFSSSPFLCYFQNPCNKKEIFRTEKRTTLYFTPITARIGYMGASETSSGSMVVHLSLSPPILLFLTHSLYSPRPSHVQCSYLYNPWISRVI